jgi:hypothetical protein
LNARFQETVMSLRSWATPLTIGSTVIVTVTGLLLFFHAAPGLTRPAHEWIGWIMTAAVVAHVILNFRAFKGYFRRPVALGILGASALVMGLSFIDPAPGGGAGGNPMVAVMGAMGRAQVETVIALAGHDTAEGLALLAAAGIEAKGGQSIAEITGGDREVQGQVIAALFQ